MTYIFCCKIRILVPDFAKPGSPKPQKMTSIAITHSKDNRLNCVLGGGRVDKISRSDYDVIMTSYTYFLAKYTVFIPDFAEPGSR